MAALSGQSPRPGGSRRKARGVDGESACRATMVSGHYAATRTCVPATDPLVEGSDYVCSIDPKAEPVRYATLAASTYIRSGGTPLPRSLLQQCKGTGAPRRMGPFSLTAYCSQSAFAVTHPALESVMFLSSPFGGSNHTFRAAPSGTRPVSR